MYTILKEDLLSFIRLNVEDRKDKNDSNPKHIDFDVPLQMKSEKNLKTK